jgi:hypothetical protein
MNMTVFSWLPSSAVRLQIAGVKEDLLNFIRFAGGKWKLCLSQHTEVYVAQCFQNVLHIESLIEIQIRCNSSMS